jgi:hypothetical protein
MLTLPATQHWQINDLTLYNGKFYLPNNATITTDHQPPTNDQRPPTSDQRPSTTDLLHTNHQLTIFALSI